MAEDQQNLEDAFSHYELHPLDTAELHDPGPSVEQGTKPAWYKWVQDQYPDALKTITNSLMAAHRKDFGEPPEDMKSFLKDLVPNALNSLNLIAPGRVPTAPGSSTGALARTTLGKTTEVPTAANENVVQPYHGEYTLESVSQEEMANIVKNSENIIAQQNRAGFKVIEGTKTEEPSVRLYRAEPTDSTPGKVSDWVKDSPEYKATLDSTGRWFASDSENLQWYHEHLKNNGIPSKTTYVDVSPSTAEQYRVSNLPKDDPARGFSRRAEEEFFLPRDLAEGRQDLVKSPGGKQEVLPPESKVDLEQKPWEYGSLINKTI